MPKSAKSGGGYRSLNDDLEEMNLAHRLKNAENISYILHTIGVILGLYHIEGA